jgi:biotin carboxyl carrier protein
MKVRGRRFHEPSPESMGEAGDYGLCLIVSPTAGRVRHLPPQQFHRGAEWLSAGQPVAVIEHGATTTEVLAPVEARVGRVLARDGEPVVRGQPLVWLERETTGFALRPGPGMS